MYNSTVLIAGKAFTFDPERAMNKSMQSIGRPTPKALADYSSPLYWLHDPNKTYMVSHTAILGRCHEAASMGLWFPMINDGGDSQAIMNVGVQGSESSFRTSLTRYMH